jgi:hypothetical protein
MGLDLDGDRFCKREVTFYIDALRLRHVLWLETALSILVHHVQTLLLAISKDIRKAKGRDDRVVDHMLIVGSEPRLQEKRASRLHELLQMIAGFLLRCQGAMMTLYFL